MQDVDSFYEVIVRHKDRVRYLFFGHVHRAIWGNWMAISYSCMRGLDHQAALDLKVLPERSKGNFEPPAYGVVLHKGDQVTVRLLDFTNASDRFEL